MRGKILQTGLAGVVFLGTGALKAQVQTFNYTGAVQTYAVPSCVIGLKVDLKGAEGAGGPPSGQPVNVGGKGGRVQATIDVNPGETLNIYVGEKPAGVPGGFNGGGNGGPGQTGGGGGGASDIRRGTSLNNRLIVAGGGGGASYTCVAGGDFGGNGGGLNAAHGTDCNTYGGPGAGKGGTQTIGGAAATGCGTSGSTMGMFGIGGNGGGSNAQPGGAGGGGYYGGGGGNCRGGGGGSSFTHPGATGVVHALGHQVGHGQVIIESTVSGTKAPRFILGPDSICKGKDTLSFQSDSIVGATSYTWTATGGYEIVSGQGTLNVKVVPGDSNGVIKVKAVSSCGESAEFSKTIKVFPRPVARFTFPDTVQVFTYVQFLDSSMYASSWNWNFGDSSESTEQHPFYVYTKTGTYLVVLKAGNGLCTDSIIKTIVVVDSGAIGLQALYAQRGRLFPVPAHDRFTLALAYDHTPTFVRVDIVDVWGRKVYSRLGHADPDGLVQVRVAGLGAGSYLVHAYVEGHLLVYPLIINPNHE